MTMLPLKMFKKVCRFRMFSVSHPPIWPPVTCRGSCSPSVGLSPHPDELAGGCDWTKRHAARPARLRPRDHRCPKYQASIRTAQVHLNLWMLMFTAFHREKKVTRQVCRRSRQRQRMCFSRTPSGSFRSRSRDNLCS